MGAKTLFLGFWCGFFEFYKKFAQTAFMCDNVYTSLAEVSVRPQASSEGWVFLFMESRMSRRSNPPTTK
jgi:hypothetical protein